MNDLVGLKERFNSIIEEGIEKETIKLVKQTIGSPIWPEGLVYFGLSIGDLYIFLDPEKINSQDCFFTTLNNDIIYLKDLHAITVKKLKIYYDNLLQEQADESSKNTLLSLIKLAEPDF